MTLLLHLAVALGALAAPDAERALYEHAVALTDRSARGYAAIALEELARYDRLYPDGRFTDDVHYRMARAESALDRHAAAAARLLEVLIVDRGSAREAAAREELDRLLDGRRGLKALRPRIREALERYGPDSGEGGEEDARLRFFRALLLVDDREALDVAAAEGALYLERDPLPSAAPEVALALGDLERRRGNPQRAVAAYERVATLLPSGPLVPRAMLAAGQVLERDLDDPLAAVAAYQRVARDRPGALEAATAWLRMGEIERRDLKRPEIAIRDYDEVLTRYPDHPDAFEALVAKAETLGAAHRDYEGAERVLVAGAERYASHARAPELLESAARIAERNRRDIGAAAGHLEELATRYPAYAKAASSLYHAAELREKSGERERAAVLYREMARRFPASSQAEKARKRAESLARRSL